MKTSIVLLSIFLSVKFYSQVIIGDAIGTATAAQKSSVLLEFANTNNKGLILPYVRTKASSPTEGAVILDVSDPNNARVKYYNNNSLTSDRWTDLSGQGANVSTILSSQPTSSTNVELAEAKTVIGASTTTVNDGVLVLESTTKAMVLPIVSDVNNIPSPSPGMMVFVNKTGAKRLAVFNGTVWSFWRP